MTKADRFMVQVRLPRALVREVDHLSVDMEMNRTQMAEFLLRRGLEHLERHPEPVQGCRACAA